MENVIARTSNNAIANNCSDGSRTDNDIGIAQEEVVKDNAAVMAEWKKKRQQQQRLLDEKNNNTSEWDVLVRDDDNNNNNNPENDNDKNDDDFVITAAKRRRMEENRIVQERITKYNINIHNDHVEDAATAERKNDLDGTINKFVTEGNESHGIDDNNHPEVNTDKDDGDKNNDENDEHQHDNNNKVESLLNSLAALHKKNMTAEERVQQQRNEEEERILREASKIQKSNLLQAAHDVAQGVIYNKPMPTMWTPPTTILQQGQDVWQAIRNEWHMQVQGDDIPPPIKRFVDMKLPEPILRCLKDKNIQKPTPIQIQGLTVALACRDMVGIAFTGSGKTLTFSIPLVLVALEEELRMPIVPSEGPIGIVLAPSRELARQTYELVNDFCTYIQDTPGYPKLYSQLLIGGESIRDQMNVIKTTGVHCIVATPGRLRDILKRKALNLQNCRYICLDEADRMLDMGFDDEVSEIMNYFTYQRQTLLFSATFPRKFQDFARQTLVKPIVVNVGRAGAANLDVIQEVEYVKDDAKIVYLLHCLQKTAPPVIIFCERKGSADDIHEYLLLKGVEAVCIHGGKDQEDRNEAIRLFKDGTKDVLIATDIAAKGLDFPSIQHVINFDMPSEIENYVHRIGRTGRAGKTGVATTFINKNCDETTLLDLKALLKEAKQRIPPVLDMLDDPRELLLLSNGSTGAANAASGGCSFCGGLGHSIVDCPKIDKDARRVAGSHRDFLASGGGNW